MGIVGLLAFAALLYVILRRLVYGWPAREDKYDTLRKLSELQDSGALTEMEFAEEKRRLLAKE